MVGTCACPALHVPARPSPKAPHLSGEGDTGGWGEQEVARGQLVTA